MNGSKKWMWLFEAPQWWPGWRFTAGFQLSVQCSKATFVKLQITRDRTCVHETWKHLFVVALIMFHGFIFHGSCFCKVTTIFYFKTTPRKIIYKKKSHILFISLGNLSKCLLSFKFPLFKEFQYFETKVVFQRILWRIVSWRTLGAICKKITNSFILYYLLQFGAQLIFPFFLKATLLRKTGKKRAERHQKYQEWPTQSNIWD